MARVLGISFVTLLRLFVRRIYIIFFNGTFMKHSPEKRNEDHTVKNKILYLCSTHVAGQTFQTKGPFFNREILLET